MLKKLKFFLLSIIFIVVIVIIGVIIFVRYSLTSLSPNSTEMKSFTIQKGASISRIGSDLVSEGLIRSQLAFRLGILQSATGNNLQAGSYQLSPNMTVLEIISTLKHGTLESISVTIPEGYRREQIAETIESKLGIPYDDFILASQEYEGYLFPETYFFSKESVAKDVVTRLNSTWHQKVDTLNLTIEDVILASIVERETLTDVEKPVVAGILKKRLKEGWSLEVDASIQYILGKKGNWWRVPLLGDRETKSPYNTYLNMGLPPAPICNPGFVALQAVSKSEESPYYFYLHGKDGVIHYARSNAEHELNIAKYIR